MAIVEGLGVAAGPFNEGEYSPGALIASKPNDTSTVERAFAELFSDTWRDPLKTSYEKWGGAVVVTVQMSIRQRWGRKLMDNFYRQKLSEGWHEPFYINLDEKDSLTFQMCSRRSFDGEYSKDLLLINMNLNPEAPPKKRWWEFWK